MPKWLTLNEKTIRYVLNRLQIWLIFNYQYGDISAFWSGSNIVCMYKGWAIKLALAPRPLMIYCASPLAAAIIVTVAALRIVLAHGGKPT
jgi:hypothetical protein